MKSLGGRLGCGAAFLIAVVVSLPLLFALAWSGAHCEPVPQCQRQNEMYFGAMIAGVLALALFVGLAVRWAVNRLAASRADEGTSAGFMISVAAAVLVISGVAIWAVFAILD